MVLLPHTSVKLNSLACLRHAWLVFSPLLPFSLGGINFRLISISSLSFSSSEVFLLLGVLPEEMSLESLSLGTHFGKDHLKRTHHIMTRQGTSVIEGFHWRHGCPPTWPLHCADWPGYLREVMHMHALTRSRIEWHGRNCYTTIM